ncbi:MAG: TonB-dependent receptor [Pseudomonadota bacterium]|nr:TonB-dependent receptor [Pseudomonadota bacterium]
MSPASHGARILVLVFIGTGPVDTMAGPSEEDDWEGTPPPAIHATRLDYPEVDSPEAVTVITAEDIRLAGYIEISEIFRSVPGFRVLKIGDDSRVSYHGTTAIQQRRLLVTIDGKNVLIGNGQYVEFDRLPIDLEDISRVTITRGPNGAAWGDNAFLASIDFQTTSRDSPRGISVRAGGGANDREKVGASLHEQLGEYSIAFSLGTEQDGGYDYADVQQTPRDDGKRINRARLTLERPFTDRSLWRVDASAYDADNKTGVRALGLNGNQENDGFSIALSNEREVGETSRLDWFVSHNRQRELIRHSACYTPETIAGVLTSIDDPELQAGLLAPTLFVPALLGTPLADTCFYTDQDVDAEKTEVEVEYESRLGSWRYLIGGSGSRVSASSAAAFAGMDQRQDTYRLFGESAVSLGRIHTSLGFMAQDSSNVADVEWGWRAAVNWQLLENQMLRYSFARSVRIPSLVESETYWTSRYFFGRRGEPFSTYQFSLSAPITTNAVSVEPETIDAHALGYFGTFLRSRINVDAKVFEERVRDPVEAGLRYFYPPPSNGPAFRLRGAEVEVSLRLTERWRAHGQYSYLDSSATSFLERLLHGDHASSFSTSYRMSDRHALTIGYYGNSSISGHSYDRYDLVWNYQRNFGNTLFRSQFIFQHHVGGADGIRSDEPLISNEGYFADLNHLYLFLELSF